MKIKTTIATLSLLSVLSFGASAAVTQVNSQEAQNLQSMGSISVSQIGSSPMDMRQAIAAKAEKAGASSYRVTELQKVLTGTLLQNCTNKPSSSKSDDLPPPAGGFFMSYIE